MKMKMTIAERIILDKDLEGNTSSFSYISHQKFLDILDELEHSYLNDYEPGVPILGFLDCENIDRELLLKINPLDIIRELHKCDMNGSICNEFSKNKDFTPRFIILMALCEELTWANRPTPIFKYKDILKEKNSNGVIRVLDYVKEDDDYIFEDLNGTSDRLCREDMERDFVKIGEVSDDVLKKPNPNLK